MSSSQPEAEALQQVEKRDSDLQACRTKPFAAGHPLAKDTCSGNGLDLAALMPWCYDEVQSLCRPQRRGIRGRLYSQGLVSSRQSEAEALQQVEERYSDLQACKAKPNAAAHPLAKACPASFPSICISAANKALLRGCKNG